MNMQEKDALEQQTDNFETYLFTTATDTYRYTSYNEDVIIAGETFQKAPIQRSEYDQNIVEGTITVSIQAPITTLFAQYIAGMPFIPIQVEIRRYFANNTAQSVTVFNGEIVSVTIDKATANAECVSSMAELNRKIPRVFMQSFCNNSLFGPVCYLDWSDPAYYVDTLNTLVVDENDRTILESPLFDLRPANFYTLGMTFYSGEYRYITSHNANIIVLHFPYLNLVSGESIIVYAGCDKDPETCHNKFNNIENFVGMPYIPLAANPVVWGVD